MKPWRVVMQTLRRTTQSICDALWRIVAAHPFRRCTSLVMERRQRFDDITYFWPLLAAVIVTSSGCAADRYPVKIQPELVNTPGYSVAQKLEGKVLVLTDAEDDRQVSSIAPRNRGFGSLTRIEIALGRLVGEATTSAFGELFADGAEWLNPPTRLTRYSAVVQPRVLSFSYRYENVWSGPVVAVMETAVSVAVLDTAGTTIWEHTYSSGPFRGEPVAPPIEDTSDISPAIHKQFHSLMVKAALDFADAQFQAVSSVRR